MTPPTITLEKEGADHTSLVRMLRSSLDRKLTGRIKYLEETQYANSWQIGFGSFYPDEVAQLPNYHPISRRWLLVTKLHCQIDLCGSD